MKYHVSSFCLTVGKGKKKVPCSFLFVDFGMSLESANRYSFFMLLWKAVSSLPRHKANLVPNGSPNSGQKGGKLLFF